QRTESTEPSTGGRNPTLTLDSTGVGQQRPPSPGKVIQHDRGPEFGSQYPYWMAYNHM
ncbi:hypothetical protein STEG23_001396, partial [Scotinomys teguina]